MRTTKTIEIDGFKYELFGLAPSKALAVAPKLLKIISPVLASIPKNVEIEKVLSSDAGDFLSSIAAGLDDPEIIKTINTLLSSVNAIKQAGNDDSLAYGILDGKIDTHFNDDSGIIRLGKLLLEVVKNSFSSVFSAIRSTSKESAVNNP